VAPAIRPAKVEDIPLLIKARLDFLSALDYPVLLYDLSKAHYQLVAFLSEHLERDLFACIALDGETLAAAGFLQVMHVMWQPAAPEGTYGRIINILTWPEFRHQGLAREIMQALIQKARELDLAYVDLDASPEGQPLYESLGFNLLQAKHPPMRLYL
jgi:ribosomal protein S18 acetylase RimI-like enzyme